jgi:CheY-like chemotaxis protein
MTPRILAVENDPATRSLFQAVFRMQQWEADAVASGAHALLLLEHVVYDAIVLDIMLGAGSSGGDVLARIATTSPELLPHIVVVSAASEPQLQAIRDRYPQVTVMRKPFELHDLIDVLMTIVRPPPADREEDRFTEFVRGAVVLEGARAGLIVETDGQTVSLARTFGYAPSQYEGFFPASVEAPYPICAAIRQQRTVTVASLNSAMHEYPPLEKRWKEMSTHALAAVPLLHGSAVVGAAGFSFLRARTFNDAAREQLRTIAALATPLVAR